MPLNKNALLRYRCLDEMLSSKHHTRQELTDFVNENLGCNVSKRCVEKDLIDIQNEWGIEYDERVIAGKKQIRYDDRSFTIFNRKLKTEERIFLKSYLDAIGKFDGLPNFKWLEDLRRNLSKNCYLNGSSNDLDNNSNEKFIQFSSNPYLTNSNMIAGLFQHIASKQVINIVYKPFYLEEPISETVSPYRLKQYNDRWYLLCSLMPGGEFRNFPLDRIVSFDIADGAAFMPCPIDINEHFEDIIGVTYIKDAPVQKVVFAGSPNDMQYILTKPLHESQKRPSVEEQERLHKEYPEVPSDWVFVSIECKSNPELITTLFSFGERIIIVSPQSIISDITEKLSKMLKLYNPILTDL